MNDKENIPLKGELTPRAYARILSMIGDQLIKNEKIALMELIKNSYDADSDWVQIRFINFVEEGDKLIRSNNSIIEIEDEGDGMDFATLSSAWMNPASPNKYLLKENKEDKTKKKKRIIQGEKGIGRFATLKIGDTIEIITRSSNSPNEEITLKSNFVKYDNELLGPKNVEIGIDDKVLFLDQMRFTYERKEKPIEIVKKQITVLGEKKERKPHGTIIRITNIKEDWSRKKLTEVVDDLEKLNFSFIKDENKDVFECELLINGFIVNTSKDKVLSSLFNRAPIRVKQGIYDSIHQTISFILNGKEITISVQRLKENKDFKKHFCDKKGNILRNPHCGSFNFEFYIFDLNASANTKNFLDKEENIFIKSHRVYLYRDGVRVYPYGDPSDDWLGIDVLRGTGRAGDYLSNDQTVGYIGITRQGNPSLKDKTNREGLLEIGTDFDDFKTLILSILGILKKEFEKHIIVNRHKGFLKIEKESETQRKIESLLKHLKKNGDSKSISDTKKLLNEYKIERKVFWDRLNMSEDLAAVGLSVESTSHDTVLMVLRVQDEMKSVKKILKSDNYEIKNILTILDRIRDGIDFIYTVITGIQPIFRSLKRGSKTIEVSSVIQNVRKYYAGILADRNINILIKQEGASLFVDCNESVLLQVFINLVDNAVYWLDTVDIKNKEIQISINKSKKEIIFADNGPGIDVDDVDFIFEPFFTTKGVDGRGMGLYIAKQLLGRNDFDINYISIENKKILNGANFSISFDAKGDK